MICYNTYKVALRYRFLPAIHQSLNRTVHVHNAAIIRGLRATPQYNRFEQDESSQRQGYEEDLYRDLDELEFNPPEIRSKRRYHGDESFPDAHVSSTAPFQPLTAEERQALNEPEPPEMLFDLPPLADTSDRRQQAGVTSSPRYDSYQEYDSLRRTLWEVRPPRLNVRRYIRKAADDSEYIFGTSVVESAIKSKRRKLYRLYIYSSPKRTGENRARDQKMKALARQFHPDIEIIDEPDIGKLDSMADSRPHKCGYILECDPIEKVPINSLGAVSHDRAQFGLKVAQHCSNPRINLREQPNFIKTRNPNRYPFVIIVDEILDPGNLGAIIRSVYYLGADALFVSQRNCAPLSAVCLKSAAGATEHLPVFECTNYVRFIQESTLQGWKFYAAIPTLSSNQTIRPKNLITESQIGNPLEKFPCCLILGSEGEGLRPLLTRQAHFQVTINHGKNTDGTVNSLNVSVATAILCNRFLNPPQIPHFVIHKGKVKKVIVSELGNSDNDVNTVKSKKSKEHKVEKPDKLVGNKQDITAEVRAVSEAAKGAGISDNPEVDTNTSAIPSSSPTEPPNQRPPRPAPQSVSAEAQIPSSTSSESTKSTSNPPLELNSDSAGGGTPPKERDSHAPASSEVVSTEAQIPESGEVVQEEAR